MSISGENLVTVDCSLVRLGLKSPRDLSIVLCPSVLSVRWAELIMGVLSNVEKIEKLGNKT
jgi:hypothetical protein